MSKVVLRFLQIIVLFWGSGCAYQYVHKGTKVTDETRTVPEGSFEKVLNAFTDTLSLDDELLLRERLEGIPFTFVQYPWWEQVHPVVKLQVDGLYVATPGRRAIKVATLGRECLAKTSMIHELTHVLEIAKGQRLRDHEDPAYWGVNGVLAVGLKAAAVLCAPGG